MEGDLWEWEEYDARAQDEYDRGAFDEALQTLHEGLALHPGSPELWVSLGYTQLAREAYAWAREAFVRALGLEEDHEEALVGLGDVLLKLGERARAFRCFGRVLELGFGSDPDLLLAMARALYREELYERAVNLYRMALGAAEAAAGASTDHVPSDERIRVGADGVPTAGDVTVAEAAAELAYALYQMDGAERALPLLEGALARHPDHHEARVFYGNLLYDRGDYERALEEFERVPPDRMWDPLAVWRAVELLRGFRGLPPDADAIEPLMRQLEILTEEPAPEERLLAEIEAAADPGSAGASVPDRNQLDLFVLERGRPEARNPGVHVVRARDGKLYAGDWAAIVQAMRDDSTDPNVSIFDYMRDAARVVRSLTGMSVPDDDPERFLRASARAGILRIER
ncbi:MAG: tetratricopeptide repeat protein [Candidatus Palauibacterales bacterium]|nr:tetratricopeptide repeat protein [Candidatus Palauibacterales bacterium]MDP2528505.1 tetratricopeptide repeat protein [Candidatus Palauibacterales bacterium]MDP2584026.1 tetratricopeptide repeat protein [Candidatus Palauibacterales bacterium]